MDILYTLIIYPVTQIIELVFVFAQKMFRETGVSIMCVSGVISVLCLPLYLKAEVWRTKEREIQRRLKAKAERIKAVFKGDEQYMTLSAYYRQNHYHPVYATRTAFGLFLQVPFFIAAYSYLSHSPLLNGARFLFISDLARPDGLIKTITGGGGALNILPVVMTAVNMLSASLYTKGFSFKEKAPLYGMALLFLAALYNSPAGLVLYWTTNNIFSLLKNIYTAISFKRKKFILLGGISFFALLFSYYTLFIHHGNTKTRILIAILSLLTGVFPWIIPAIIKLIKKFKIAMWTPKETFSLFLLSSFVLWAATGVFIPSTLINASPQEFSFIDDGASPLVFIFNAALQGAGLFIFWPLVLYFLFSQSVKKSASIAAAITAFTALCNIFIFPGDYGYISNDLVFSGSVGHDLREIIVNLIVLTIPVIILLFLYIRGAKKTLSFLCTILFLASIFYSGRNIYRINNEFVKLSEYYTPNRKTEDTIMPILHLSKTGKNILVIMLDMAESVFIPYIFDESTELREQFSGFVYFPNTITFNGWTYGGAPPIFGGYEYTPVEMNKRADVPWWKKSNEALRLMPRLLSGAGFSVVVTDPPYAGNNWIPDLRVYGDDSSVSGYITDGVYTDLWLKRNNIALPPHSAVLKRNVLWYALFRELPLAFRQAVYAGGAWSAPFSEYRMRLMLNGYAVLDYLDELTDFSSPAENAAVFMVNNTTHESFFLEAPEYRPRLNINDYGKSRFSKSRWYHVNAAAMKRLAEYFDFLKANNVYDNTRIILVSDHAGLEVSYITKTALPFHVDQFNALLMVKDFNAAGELKTDITFMTNADVPSLAAEGIIENPVNPFTGNMINGQKNPPFPVLIKRVNKINETEIELNSRNLFYVKDNIFDAANWQKAD